MDVKDIENFYANRSVFITGASGFMGKVLVEKLLYGCPSLSRIYILLRPKKCVSISSRLDAMFRTPVFMHISTAFCHVDITEMKEKVYDSDVIPDDIIRMTQWLDDDTIEIITPRLLGPHPNCYTYSKRLAETLVEKHYPKLPVSIVRPPIVVPAWKEPVPGWVDNLNGPMGLLVGGAKGVIRTMYCKGEYIAEVIPVDYAINAIIGFSWLTTTKKDRQTKIPVLNITESKSIPVSWNEIMELGKKACYENPFEMMLWYPDGNIHSSWIVHMLCVIFFHWLPAILIDMLMIIFRQKTFMVRVQRRITEGLNVLQYFTTKQWIFHSETLKDLKTSLTEHDKKMFPLTTDGFDITSYFRESVLGARHFLMKEDPKSLPRQRKILKVLYVLHKFVSLAFYVFIMYTIISFMERLRHVLSARNFKLSVKPFGSTS
ncbi:putative fatty acyl-CoA reductase CG5065 isoform X2 [Lycorma delicatula]|uniref:putative fatty acyl-CoA reductase CG5065 isoform X2 n=1 Tax=Lycorma delicatula TaxID=130591 RepID=UPI003F5141DF